MKRYLVGTLFVGSLLAILALAPASDTLAAADGKAVFDAQKCSMCHSVQTLGITAKTKAEEMLGKDLSKVETDPALLAKYLRKQEKIGDKDHKKEIKISDEEMTALIDWLRSDKS
jgi:mono/diheme cytochrome c family protein